MGEAVIPTKPDVDEATKKTLADAIIDALANLDARAGALEASGNQIANGSFEVLDGDGDPDGWVFSGTGAYAIDKAEDASPSIAHGARALKLSVTGSSKTESATTADYSPVAKGDRIEVGFIHKVSAATLDVKAEVLWYDEDKGTLSSTTVYNSTGGNPTSYAKRYSIGALAPASARFYKVRLTITSDSDAVGTLSAWFDGVYARAAYGTPVGVNSLSLTLTSGPDYFVDVAGALNNGELPKCAVIKVSWELTVPETGDGNVYVLQALPDGTFATVFSENVPSSTVGTHTVYLTVALDQLGRFKAYTDDANDVTMTVKLMNYWV